VRRYFIYIGFLFLFATSCEEPLEYVDTTDRLLIDAQITNRINASYVRITQLNSFPDTSSAQGISGAWVEVKDEYGRTEVLNESDTPGLYRFSTLRGRKEFTYFLTIRYAGNEYTSVARMPEASRQFELVSVKKDDYYQVGFVFRGATTLAPHYRLELYMPGRWRKDFYELRLYTPYLPSNSLFNQLFAEGTIVWVDISSLSEEAFQYFEALYVILTNPPEDLYSRPFYFPEGNIKGAEGIFRASEIITQSIVLQEDDFFGNSLPTPLFSETITPE